MDSCEPPNNTDVALEWVKLHKTAVKVNKSAKNEFHFF
jgi:hypothetical protein